MTPIRIPVKPRPPVPPGSAVWPPKPVPPDPGPITPPGPRGEPPPKVDPPDTITPGGQPPTPDPTPTGIAPDWSDACVLVRHRAGSYWVDVWLGGRLVRASVIGFVSLNQDWLNRDIHGVLRFAPNTDVEPWPVRPGSAVQKSASKEKLMADEKPTFEQEMLAALAELRHGLAVLGDQIAALTARFDAPVTPEPPAPPVDDDAEFWDQFCAAPDPDPETFEPEMFTSYSRGRVLYQWRAQYTPLGKLYYPQYPVGLMMDYIRAMRDPASAQAARFIRHGVDFETAVYAILSGRVDDLFDTGFAARPLNQIRALAGKNAAALFAADIAGEQQGGTPGIGG